jgi:succinyl-CoA synthetase beta subunit
MRSSVLVCVGESELLANGISLEKPEGVADADVEVGARHKAGAIEIGTKHEEQVSRGTGILYLR